MKHDLSKMIHTVEITKLIVKDSDSKIEPDDALDLFRAGLDICKELEKATNIPTYYYLFHSNGLSGKIKTPAICPSCGANWKLTGEKTFILLGFNPPPLGAQH